MPDRTKEAACMELGRLGLAAAGVILIGIGGYLHYPPLGFVAAGGLLYVIALIGTLRAR